MAIQTLGSGCWMDIVNKLHICKSESEINLLLTKLLDKKNSPLILSFVNAHAYNVAWENKIFAQNLLSSDYILRDGIGVKLLLRCFGSDPGMNLNGTDFIPKILELLPRNTTVAIYGTEEPWLTKATQMLKGMGFSSLHTSHGFHPDQWYVEHAIKTSPELVLLAMGMPKQERVAPLIRNALSNKNTLIINGGAVIDFIAGRFPRAPKWIRSAGFEWLFRLIIQPRRLYRRYIYGNILFIIRAIKLKYLSTSSN